ncbi:hypothetical protein SO802_018302 [Lithocarpus litseifolius]|uniref:DUF4283 domain-containing protein n=1 Tax=Lithocarpus litseifolius TaxID=425828 RepID=A0AAW2CNC3_9ROSI
MENLEEPWTCLSLSEHEGEVFNFENLVCRKDYTLAAKFFMKRALNIEAVAHTLKPLWRTKQDFEIQDMGNHILLFVFDSEVDANRVLLGEPWSFDKYLVVLRRYEDDSSLRRLHFDTAKFWVQTGKVGCRFDMHDSLYFAIGVGRVENREKEYGSWLRADPPSLIRKKVVMMCGMGVPNSTSSRGQSMMERPAINMGIEGPSNVDKQQGEQRVSEVKVDGECGTGTVGDTESQGVGLLLVEESTLAGTNSGVVETLVQTEVGLAKMVSHTKQVEGSQSIQSSVNEGADLALSIQQEHMQSTEGGVGLSKIKKNPTWTRLVRMDAGPVELIKEGAKSILGKRNMLAMFADGEAEDTTSTGKVGDDLQMTESARGVESPLPRAMRLLSWNCQGLGNLWTVQSLHKLVRRR